MPHLRDWLLLGSALLFYAGAAFAADDQQAQARRELFERQGEILAWEPREWEKAYRQEARRYVVLTNASAEAAQHIGIVMDLLYESYVEIFNARSIRIPRLSVYAYADYDQYDKVASAAGFQRYSTAGFYNSEGDGVIHLAWVMLNNDTHPRRTLYHEGTHQFVHQAVNFRIPFPLRNKVDPKYHILMSVPIWLNEGLATYMETAEYDGNTLEVGRVNAQRLMHLQQLLKNRMAPPVREVLERRYGQPFSVEHYAVAWGLVYTLRHHYKLAERDRNQAALNRYIKMSSNGFMRTPGLEFPRRFMKPDGGMIDDFDAEWRTFVGVRSREVFEEEICGRTDLDRWQEQWIRRVMALDPQALYGGTYRGEVVGKGTASNLR